MRRSLSSFWCQRATRISRHLCQCDQPPLLLPLSSQSKTESRKASRSSSESLLLPLLLLALAELALALLLKPVGSASEDRADEACPYASLPTARASGSGSGDVNSRLLWIAGVCGVDRTVLRIVKPWPGSGPLAKCLWELLAVPVCLPSAAEAAGATMRTLALESSSSRNGTTSPIATPPPSFLRPALRSRDTVPAGDGALVASSVPRRGGMLSLLELKVSAEMCRLAVSVVVWSDGTLAPFSRA